VLPQHVEDEVDLRFTAAKGIAFALAQHNDRGRGRDIVVVDERVFERRPGREWIAYPLESPLWQQWLDDSWSAVHGAVELAAPRLSVSSRVVDGGGWNGGDAIEVTLSPAAERDDSLRAHGPTQTWRASASVESVSGTITFDAASGIWLRAAVEVHYAVEGADGRPQVGKVIVDGAVDAQVGRPIARPSGVQPLPLRERLQAEAEQLLEGLARP
jgi:hypothetical protein